MNKMQISALTAGVLTAGALVLTGCGEDKSSSDSMSSHAMGMSSRTMGSAAAVGQRIGMFTGLAGKMVAGQARVSNSQIVLTGFSSDEGPDLHVYLTNGTDEAAVTTGKEISTVSYNTADQTFSLDGVDAAMYSTVVIHCDKAKAVFGAASLS